MHERILVPLDGSEVGEAALPRVEALVSRLAPQVQVEVTLLQVITSLSHYVIAGDTSAQIPYTPREIEQIKKKTTDYLDKAGETLRSKGINVKTRAETGKAAEEILRVADEIKADLIAMSTHGRSGLSRWAFGSVTDKILRVSNLPILVVRAPIKAEK